MARRAFLLIFVRLLLVALLPAALGGARATTRPDRCKDGTYSATLRGYYVGTGTADVQPNAVILRITVTSADGQTAVLTASLTTSGAYFGGQGTIRGKNLTIRGRLDAVKASRVAATLWDDTGRSARLVGILPSDPGDDKWDEEPQN